MLRFALALAIALMVLTPEAGAEECLLCHSAMHGRLEGARGVVEVHIDTARFTGSVHGEIGCTSCHLSYRSGPHSATSKVPGELAALALELTLKSPIDPVAMAACSTCHATEFDEYKGSVHGMNVLNKKQSDGPLCLDCHGPAHYILPSHNEDSVAGFGQITHTCGNCHEDERITTKYGLGKHVIEKYRESFHGKKYILGHRKVPVCDDCHGSHAVTKWDAPDSPVFGEGKVRTCGKCHIGATRKFAAAPAHAYIGKENPIPYYTAKGLTILVLGTFAFILSHVFIDIFGEIRKKLMSLRKGGSDD